jgi:hypothetical protein
VGGTRTYRTRLPLRIAVAAAAVFWAVVLVALAGAPGIELRVVVSAGAFSLFFVAFTVVYGKTSITVTSDGIVAATPLRRVGVRFDEILQIVVRDGVGGRVYSVLTRRGPVHFTSLFSRHRELFELLLERADLRTRIA